jgi:hypothetical protein
MFLDADLDLGSGIFLTWTRDPGWKNSDPESGINTPIRDTGAHF